MLRAGAGLDGATAVMLDWFGWSARGKEKRRALVTLLCGAASGALGSLPFLGSWLLGKGRAGQLLLGAGREAGLKLSPPRSAGAPMPNGPREQSWPPSFLPEDSADRLSFPVPQAWMPASVSGPPRRSSKLLASD